jgi:prevent-host-death family protein
MGFMTKEIKSVTATDFRKRVAWFIGHVHFTGHRIEIWRHGKHSAALVSIADLEVLEELDRKTVLELEIETQAKIERWKRVRREDYNGD